VASVDDVHKEKGEKASFVSGPGNPDKHAKLSVHHTPAIPRFSYSDGNPWTGICSFLCRFRYMIIFVLYII
jgi:hypothetical protein